MVKAFLTSFEVDLVSLEQQAKTIAPSKYDGATKAGLMIHLHFSQNLSEQEEADLDTYFGNLTEQGEATKLAQPSRKIGQDLVNLFNEKKAACAAKTWDQMSAAERKLVMNVGLTASEIDSL